MSKNGSGTTRNHALNQPKNNRMVNLTTKPKKGLKSRPGKSSKEARKLINAALKKSCDYTEDGKPSVREAARILHLPNHAQLIKMKNGLIKDTPAMKIEIARADERARKAWLKISREHCSALDAPATLRAAQRALDQAHVMITMLMKASEE